MHCSIAVVVAMRSCCPVRATLAEELAGFQYRNHRFLALLGQDSELDPAFLNVEYRIGGISLREDGFILSKFQRLFSCPHFGEKRFGIKSGFGLLPHKSSFAWKALNSTVQNGHLWSGNPTRQAQH